MHWPILFLLLINIFDKIVFHNECQKPTYIPVLILTSRTIPRSWGVWNKRRRRSWPACVRPVCSPRLTTNSFIFCWLFAIKDRCIKVRFQQLTVSLLLCSSVSKAQAVLRALEGRLVSSKSPSRVETKDEGIAGRRAIFSLQRGN